MNIKRLEIENFKRIGVVDITPDGKVIMITGKNANGKTSVLDAIWAALSNPRISEIPKPIKEGEEKAIITVDLERYVVRRVFTDAGTRLTVTGAEGAEFKSPQALLDKLIGGLTFDPLAFIRMKEKEQVEMLLKLAGSDVDLEGMDKARASIYEERTTANKMVKELSTLAGDEPEKVTKVDISKIQMEMETVAKFTRTLDSLEIRGKSVTIQISELLKEQDALIISQKETINSLSNYKSYIELKAELDKGIEHNQNVGAWDKWNEQHESLLVYSNKATELDNKIKEIDAKKKLAIANIKFPYEGLGFDDIGVTYNGIPLKQASKAEQTRISVALAMSMNPELRVLRIEDGSLLDEDNLKLIHELAEKYDYQVWVETVQTGEVGIIIEDGMVKNER